MLSSSISVIGMLSCLRIIIFLDETSMVVRHHFVLILALCEKCKVRSAYSSIPTWLTDPSPGNRLRPAAQGIAQQECPCRARLRCSCNGTSNGSTRPLCQAPFRYHELVSQLQQRYSKADSRRFSVSSSVVQDQPDQPASLSRDIQVWSRRRRSVKQMLMKLSSSHAAGSSGLASSFLTSSLGRHISRPWPRRIDLHNIVSRQRQRVTVVPGLFFTHSSCPACP